MSSESASTESLTVDVDAVYPSVEFDPEEWAVIEQAVESGRYESPEAFITHAALLHAADLVEDAGVHACEYDGCEAAFASERQLHGHVGAVHESETSPDDYWCLYCGYGPASDRAIAAHHGSSDGHDGDVERVSEPPAYEDLIAPDAIPDHKNPEILERLYEAHGGSYTAMCRDHDFDVQPGRVRHYLIEFGIHEPTPHGAADGDADCPKYRDPEWLDARYDEYDGNISELYRNVDVDAAYRTLINNLKRFGIHDPTNPPGRRQANQQRADEAVPDDDPDEESADDDDQGDLDDEFDADETDAGAGDDAASEDADDPVPLASVVTADPPTDANSFDDLDVPDWLGESTFHIALQMSETPAEFAENLGWGDPNDLEAMVNIIGESEAFAGGDAR